ncbi:MAG: flagellar filament capping protein FliD [Clostridium sp.]
MRITGMATGMDTDAAIKDMLKPQQLRIDNIKQQQQIVSWQQELYRDVIKDVQSIQSKYFDVLNKDTYLLSSNTLNGNKVTVSNPALSITANSDAKEGTYEVSDVTVASNASFKGADAGSVDMGTKLSDLGITTTTPKDYLEFAVNGGAENIKVEIDAEMTVGDLSKAISEASKGEVKLEYSEISKSFELSTTKTGKSATLEVVKGADFFTNKLNVDVSTASKGTDASCKVTLPNGESGIITSETNNFTKDGINFDLSGAKTGDTFSITITKDTEKPVKLVKDFIEDYNKLIDKVNKLNTEKRNYSYKPLTDEQKKEMSDEEIKKWESQAKKGVLKGDSYLNNMMVELRTSMFGDKDTLFAIGITTSNNVQDGGKLVLDEDKFKKALANDPEKTMNTFKIGMEKVDKTLDKYASTTTLGSNGKRGLLVEKAGIDGSVTDKNNILSKKILEQEDMIKVQTRKMNEMENRYYLQFAQLEKTMNSLNSQMNWFMQQMGG